MNEWIKCEDKLPLINETGEYLIWDDYNASFEVARWTGEGWFAQRPGALGIIFEFPCVTYWMKLPKEPI